MIHLCGPYSKQPNVIDTTSRSTNWSRELSPFFLGPVDLYGGNVAKNVENGWQFSKVYAEYAKDGEPTEDYFRWAKSGWGESYAHRYPMGKGAKPLYSYWDGEKLPYVEARRRIYCPLYAKAVEKTDAFKKLKEIYEAEKTIYLWDFDAYDHHKVGKTYKEVLLNSDRKMGHAFVLAMMLDNDRVWE